MNTKTETYSSFFDSLPEHRLHTALIRGAIAATIINKRHELGLTQKDFAKKCGVSQGMVSKWESAEYNFTIATLSELMSMLEIPFDVLLDGKSATNQDYQRFNNTLPQDWDVFPTITLCHFSDAKGAA